MHVSFTNFVKTEKIGDWIFFLAIFFFAKFSVASHDLKSLVRNSQEQMISTINQYVAMETERLERLRKTASAQQMTIDGSNARGSEYLLNPVNAFLTVKRLTISLENLSAEVRTSNETIAIAMQNLANLQELVDLTELRSSAATLFQLQDFYKMTAKEMADGIIAGRKAAGVMTAGDCTSLGLIAIESNDYYHTILWLTEAFERFKLETIKTADAGEILENLAFAYFHTKNFKWAFRLTQELILLYPDHPRAEGNLEIYKNSIPQNQLNDPEMPPLFNPMGKRYQIYEELCRGEHQLPIVNQSKLFCFYKTTGHPYLRIAPFKVELVHLKPAIYLFHNVISDSEVDLVTSTVEPRLISSTVQDPVTGEHVPDKRRVSRTGWIPVFTSPEFGVLDKRIGLMTGLSMSTAEDLQIASYSIGGKYDPHYDFARKHETNAFRGLNTGNRIATVLFYMIVPEIGGATVFPELKLTLFPSKNDAVLWWNLFPSGEQDMTTLHAGCPVLIGQKWVLNRWIHERDQEFKRPCEKEEWAYF